MANSLFWEMKRQVGKLHRQPNNKKPFSLLITEVVENQGFLNGPVRDSLISSLARSFQKDSVASRRQLKLFEQN
jgi:hypothetical protein